MIAKEFLHSTKVAKFHQTLVTLGPGNKLVESYVHSM